MDSICKIISIILIAMQAFNCSGQYRISIALDNAVGLVSQGDTYLSLTHEHFKDGFKIPSFTITKRLKDNKLIRFQGIINRSFRFNNTETWVISYLDALVIHSKRWFDYSAGLHFYTGWTVLAKPNIIMPGSYRFRPGFAFGISRDFNVTSRHFVRLQLHGLGKISYNLKKLGFGWATFFNLGVGMRFGKTDRAFPKQDDMDDH